MGLNLIWLGLYILGPALFAGLLWVLLSRQDRRRRGKPVPSLKAVTGLLAGAMGLFWLLSMAALTLVTASELRERLTGRSLQFADWGEYLCGLDAYYDPARANNGRLGRQYEYPEEFLRSLLEGASLSSNFELTVADRETNQAELLREDPYPFETAVLFRDGQGQPLFEGERLFFPYVSSEKWNSDVRSTDAYEDCSYGWVRLPTAGKGDPYARLREEYRAQNVAGSLRNKVSVLRITARIEGNEIFPTALDQLTVKAEAEAAQRWQQAGHRFFDSFCADDLDRAGRVEWEHIFGDADDSREELVTLYALDPELYLDETSPVTFRYASGETVRWDSLTAMLLEAPMLPVDRRSLGTVLTVENRSYRDPRDPSGKTVDLIMHTAVIAHPLKSALLCLWPVYLAAALLGLLLTLTLRILVRRRLLEPLRDALDGMRGDWYHLMPDDGSPRWREAEKLLEAYRAEEDRRRYEANERKRLERALDYAYAAEEQRRQFTSSLAHELKTPLAVIHSYAEGLKAHIAEEKREKYLDTLLGETERMDALVMELLDLSRLEAGRVKLSRDGFDLRAVALAEAEKLLPLAEERGQTLTLASVEACIVTADEGRIAQAVENLLTNALRYSPTGSRIKLRADKEGKRAVFRAENPVEKQFTAEELEKVWEPFWRRDKARSGEGTGLGLAIVKNIVELHGGSCAVRNTAGGVEFSFTLPL